MKSKFTICLMMVAAIFIASCTKDSFSERDAINAQKELLNLKYQHELDLETLKQRGATALQQLMNAAALQQLKINDSLATASSINAKKQDYSVVVVDVFTNAPVADADVTVSSQGKLFTLKTSAQGVATFTSLYLFPTSAFLITKTGYAATQILQQNITNGNVGLWNTTDLSNEISGTLFIDTDLTTAAAEKVGANVLVTASTTVQNGQVGSYTVYFPTFTTATGTYAIKVPAAPNGYALTFEQVVADQKLYVNSTENDAVKTFPSSLPRLQTIKTNFNVNTYSARVPLIENQYYFKFSPDKNGKVFYMPGYYYSTQNNQVLLSSVNNKFQIERLNVNYYNNQQTPDLNTYFYDINSTVDVELVDITGNIIETPPILAAYTNSFGKVAYTYSQEGGSGYIHLKRQDTYTLVPNAKGVILKGYLYDTFNNTYSMANNNSINFSTSRYVNNQYLSVSKGDKKVINFYYGSGESRALEVY